MANTVNLNGGFTGAGGASSLKLGNSSLTVEGATASFVGLNQFTTSGTSTLTLAGNSAAQAFSLPASQSLDSLTIDHSVGGGANTDVVSLTATTPTVNKTLLVNFGVLDLNGSTLSVAGAGALTITAANGTLKTSAGTLNCAVTPAISGTLNATGGTLNLNNAATAVAGAGTLTIGTGSVFVGAATANFTGLTFTAAGGTITANGVAAAQALTLPNSLSTGTLTINHPTNTDTVTLVVAGTGLTLTNALNVTSGVLNMTGQTVNVSGAAGATVTAANGSLTVGTGMLQVSNAAGALAMNGTLTVSTGSVAVTNNFTSTGGSFTVSGAATVSVGGATANFGSLATFSWAAGGTLTLNGAAATQTFTVPAAGATLGILTISHPLNTDNVNLVGTPVTVAGTLNVTSGVFNMPNAGVLTATGVATITAVNGKLTTGTGTLNLTATPVIGGTLDATGGAVNLNNAATAVSGAGTFTVATGTVKVFAATANFAGLGAMTFTSGTLQLDGAAAAQAFTPKGALVNLIVNHTTGAATDVVTLGAGVTIGGATTITKGVFETPVNVTFTGAVSVGATGTLRDTTGTSNTFNFNNTVGVAAGGLFTFTGNSHVLNFTGNVTVAGGAGAFTITGGAGAAANRITIQGASTWTLASTPAVAVSRAIIINSTASPVQDGGRLG